MPPKTHLIFASLIGIVVAATLCAPSAVAQALPLGTVSSVVPLSSCMPLYTLGGPDFRDFDTSMQSCYTAQLNCPNADTLGFVYGVAPAAQGVPFLGTIVMLTGDGGTYGGNPGFAKYYVPAYEMAGYQVVEIAWGSQVPGTAWEIANSNQNSTTTPSILNAACRVGTFLHYVKTGGIWTTGGMCVHADSGGAGGLSYSLTWYGEAADLNKVLLENGPVFSRIDEGCEVPTVQPITVCYPNTLNGCNAMTWPATNPISYSLEYIPQDASSVNLWSGNTGPACANGSNGTTTYNSAWCQMSILRSSTACGQAPPATASFNYPNTTMSAWLCQSLSDSGASFNNSMSQGGLYYAEFLQQSQTGGSLSINGVDCPTTEDVEHGSTMYRGVTYTGQPGDYAELALIQDMTTGATACTGN